ncbi:MAG TPA: MarR family transcriptional regulator [Actinomycetota bacterium]|nr:MarR family transcriptional regulator [Actinomycetota bacterium]
MSGGANDAARMAFPVFLKSCSVVVDRLDRMLQDRVGIQLTWYEVLAQLSSTSDGRMSMKQLADSVMLSKSGVTRLVDRMERAGLVQRHSCDHDGRVCFAAFTSRGMAVLKVARPVAAEGIDEYFARHLTPEEADVLARALRRVLAEAGQQPDLADTATAR